MEPIEQQIRIAIRAAAWHKGAAITLSDVTDYADGHRFNGIRPQAIIDQAELMGFPIRQGDSN